MGVRARNNNDRLRTIWTPEMDRYFIDLMLEEVSKGNKFDDHLFSKRAWKHMTSLFNDKFKFEYEKDVLKNRHKTLRNLYKAVKNLLDQKGFSWDEVRQMVTADNNVWDEYVKVHPDSRSFRIKSIPYYTDLCIIYRNGTIENKGENEANTIEPQNAGLATVESLQEIMIDEDYRISISGKSDDYVIRTKSKIAALSTMAGRSRTYWQPPMDYFFIDLMLDQVQKGNQIDGVFRKQAWIEMITSFNAKFGFSYDMDVLKNRYKTLRRQYNVIKNLLELDGFVWDDTRQMVTADDYVWQDYIKANTDARQFMTRPLPYYKDLCLICDPNVNEDCFSGQALEQHNEDEDALTAFQPPPTSISSEDEDGLVQESTCSTQKRKRQQQNFSNFVCKKKLKGENEGTSAVCSLADKKKNEDNSSPVAIERVIEAVQALTEMDEDLVLDACDFLEDEKKAKTFLALDVKLRKKWLVRKLRPELLPAPGDSQSTMKNKTIKKLKLVEIIGEEPMVDEPFSKTCSQVNLSFTSNYEYG